VFSLNADWTVGERTYRQGSLVAVDLDQLARAGGDVSVLYEPGERGGLQSVSATRNLLLVNTLENMAGRLYEYRFERGVWTRSEVPVPPNSTVTVAAADSWQADDYYITCTDFLHPTALQLVRQGIPRPVRSLSARFSTEGLEVSQHEALSADGTRIPYTVVGRRDIPHDGSTPTVLYGYGGFGWSELPRYDPVLGMAWLERGGVYVIAHTRGGGEFGARWYQAAAGRNRHRACEDFIAVAEDLVRRGITSSAHLGCWGMSNGGWLVGMAFTQRPELFGAVVAEHPPLDLSLGYAGASESGSPSDSVDWSYLRSCSPYHSLARDRVYPRPLLITGTLDATVSPGHARKMAAQMLEYGASVCFYEHPEAGHGAVDNQQRAYLDALIYTYLWQQLR
jgi:prolyl oligopeptidase